MNWNLDIAVCVLSSISCPNQFKPTQYKLNPLLKFINIITDGAFYTQWYCNIALLKNIVSIVPAAQPQILAGTHLLKGLILIIFIVL